MSWIQVSITTTQNHSTTIEDALLGYGAVSVTLKDAEDQPILEPGPGETPIWDDIVVTGLFAAGQDPAQLGALIRQQLELDPAAITAEPLADQDWTRAWMEDYHAMQFGQRLWVCPWHMEPPNPNAVNLRLDPGLAFGTGTHPTTALCLRWLDANIGQQASLLDFGCGSGILAIAALMLGAQHADGVDIDEQALLASRDNANANQVSSQLDLFSVADFDARNREHNRYDIVAANILSGPLIELSARLADCVKPQGHILLSGILREQADSVRTAYSAYFDMDAPQYEDDWVMLHGCRHPE